MRAAEGGQISVRQRLLAPAQLCRGSYELRARLVKGIRGADFTIVLVGDPIPCFSRLAFRPGERVVTAQVRIRDMFQAIPRTLSMKRTQALTNALATMVFA